MTNDIIVKQVACSPFTDQKPGTAGLRKKVSVFSQPHYLETYVQAVFNALKLPEGSALVVGGDGRYYNNRAINTIIAIAAANGVRKLIIGRNGLLSTPAASNLIRRHRADGGFVLTASHNPGGPDGDFGIKYNIANGGQAPESLTDAFFAESKKLTAYRIAEINDVDLSNTGLQHIGQLQVEVVDSVSDYSTLLQSLFDFDCMRDAISGGLRMQFDAMHGITGPYAEDIFCKLLGLPSEMINRATPLPDFGGCHPDPNPVDAPDLISAAMSEQSPALLAASDGDGDRNMIVLPGQMVSPCDSLAILLANAHLIPGYSNGMPGVARSMPTSKAADRVAEKLGVPCYETPTGWRFFCNLLDSGDIGLCGEESFGTGSSHVREKDGMWAILFWLNLLATTGKSGNEILREHWQEFGRDYYQRYDYFIEDADQAAVLFADLKSRIETSPLTLAGNANSDFEIAHFEISKADSFTYHDPVDGSVSENQGLRIEFSNSSRIVYRLSGTGTAGATLRVYLQHYEPRESHQQLDPTAVLTPLGNLASHIGEIGSRTGLSKPTAVI